MQYEAQVTELAKTYPSTTVVASGAEGMWLTVESAVLNGIDRRATFLAAIPFKPELFPRTWGYWTYPSRHWIGPRHTNFPDGSVCAFVPDSGTWRLGDHLVALFNLYSVWALRHLHLEEFHRWPGGQFSPHPFYSLIEFNDSELCNCDEHDPPRRFGQCCKPQLLRLNLAELKTDFERAMGFRITDRSPPKFIAEYMSGKSELPAVSRAFEVPAIISHRPTA
jgi:hypothetical protein